MHPIFPIRLTIRINLTPPQLILNLHFNIDPGQYGQGAQTSNIRAGDRRTSRVPGQKLSRRAFNKFVSYSAARNGP